MFYLFRCQGVDGICGYLVGFLDQFAPIAQEIYVNINPRRQYFVRDYSIYNCNFDD